MIKNADRGYALVTGLIFLTILTTVGIFTLRNTALEMMMSANNNKNAQAFEAAEATRMIVSTLIDPHVYNRGWPKTIGGAIDDDFFRNAIPTGLTISNNGNWYDRPFQTSSSFNPLDLSTVDAHYSDDIYSAGKNRFTLQGIAAVKPLRVDIQPGSNAAMSAGYEGLGKGAGAGGGNIFFYVVAQGQDPGAQATRYTAAIHRYVIRN